MIRGAATESRLFPVTVTTVPPLHRNITAVGVQEMFGSCAFRLRAKIQTLIEIYKAGIDESIALNSELDVNRIFNHTQTNPHKFASLLEIFGNWLDLIRPIQVKKLRDPSGVNICPVFTVLAVVIRAACHASLE